ncbi:MAG: 4Fe-4S binding protein, partial [Rhodoferax sp.]
MTSILALGGVTFGLVARVKGEHSSILPADRIRPPGTLRETEFLDACVRCGLCVQACPYDTLHLAEIS